MGIASVRFNKKEEQIIEHLKKYYHCDTSSLIKQSLWEKYEDIKDIEAIKEFEKMELKGKVKFKKIKKID